MKPILVLALLLLIVPTNAQKPKGMVGGDKICKCVSHGPRGGCLRWSCRRQYERPRYYGGPHPDGSTETR
jgi:hypothetical protein